MVPGYDDPHLPPPDSYLKTLLTAREGGSRIVAVCTGVFALAATGMLRGKSATTHRRHADQLRAMHPDVNVVENRLIVEDGPILTSAGASAGIDTCLHVVRTDFGATAADGVAKDVVLSSTRSGAEPSRSTRTCPRRLAPACPPLDSG